VTPMWGANLTQFRSGVRFCPHRACSNAEFSGLSRIALRLMRGDAMTRTNRTIVAIAATALSLTALVAANSASRAETGSTRVKLALLTQPGIWDAGVFAAVDRKFFDEQKLSVSFVSPATPADGLKLLASGGVQFATAHSTEVITARSRGLPVVSIGTNHQFGTAGIMVPVTSGVTSLKQLEGKTLGVTGIPFNKTMLEYSLKKSGVDLSKVKIVTVGFTPMPLLLSKRIDGLGDAITWSEPAMYNSQIKKPANDKSTYKYFAFYENGVPRYYTLGVVVEEGALAKDPELARRFLAAWTKGLDWAIKNQKAAVDGLRKKYPEINESESLANLAEIARISQSPDTAKNGLGWQDPAVWAKQEEFMREQGLIPAKVDVSKAVTNAYLPKK
jgi:ABC-type nitrate/sulfonate/bicarbonate transport system substrate-binding protein